jgi:hypothetical protein
LISKGIKAQIQGQDGKAVLLQLEGTFMASLGTDIVFRVVEIKGDDTKLD